MLSHYSPLKVAETFRMLETLYPGRIDLGIGRAPGSDQRTAQALQHGPGALPIEYYPSQIADLLAYLGPGLAADHPFAGVRAMPTGPGLPEFWILGSTEQSAAYAAHFGSAFSFAHFITERLGPEIMQAYRDAFQPSPLNAAPRGSIGVFVLCADTEEEAQRLAASRDLWRLRLDYGKITAIPSVEEALAYPYSEAERARVALQPAPPDRRRARTGARAPARARRALWRRRVRRRLDLPRFRRAQALLRPARRGVRVDRRPPSTPTRRRGRFATAWCIPRRSAACR